jgi:hypothetical protein
MSDPLLALFGGRTKVQILDVLLSHPGESYHLRGLAQAAGTDSGNTSKLLKLLVSGGLVLAEPDRHSTRYSINSHSPFVAPLQQLVALAGALVADLRLVSNKLKASYVGVFGSVAAGTAGADSDVDVLVIGDLSGVAAQTAFKPVARKHGKPVNVVTVNAQEFAQHMLEGGAFWTSVMQGPRIDLKGVWPDAAQR